jgi:hypothetical protein
VEDYRLAADAFGVLDPGFHVALYLLAIPAVLIEGILYPSGPSRAVRGARERMLLLAPAASVDADETEALCIIVRIGVI